MAETATSKIRLQLDGGREVELQLKQLGDTGERAFQRIANQNEPTSRALRSVSAVSAELSGRMQQTASSIGLAGTALGAFGARGNAVAVGIAAIAAVVVGSTRAWEEYEQSTRKVDAVLKATGNAAGLTGQQIRDMAEEIEKSTMHTSEQALDAAAALATFGNVSGAQFDRVLKSAADMSVIMGGDLKSNALALAKALEEPAEGVSRLRRAGIVFTESQREQIETLARSGKTFEATERILEQVEKRLGGAAQAARQGVTGATKSLTDAWGDLMKALGRAVPAGSAAAFFMDRLAAGINVMTGSIEQAPLNQRIAASANEETRLERELEAMRAGGADESRYAFQQKLNELERVRRRTAALIAEARAEVDKVKQAEEAGRQAAEDRQAGARNKRAEDIAEIEKEARRQVGLAGMGDLERLVAEARERALKQVMGKLKVEKEEDLPSDARPAVTRVQDLAEQAVRAAAARKQQADAEDFLAEAIKREDEALGKLAETEQRLADLRTQQEIDGVELMQAADERVAQIEAEIRATEEQVRAAQNATVEYSALHGGYIVVNRELEILNRQQRILASNQNISADKARELAERQYELAQAHDRATLSAQRLAEQHERTFGAGARKAIEAYLDDASNAALHMGDAITSAFRMGEDAVADFAATGKISVSSMVDQGIRDLARLAYQMAMVAALGSSTPGQGRSGGFLDSIGSWLGAALGGGGGGQGMGFGDAGGAGTLLGFAKGGVLASRFGDVLTRPVRFRLANGGVAEAGEAGLEGIMPLTRLPSGRLGVDASGAGAPATVVNFHVDARGAENGVEERVRAVLAEQAPNIVRQAIAGSLQAVQTEAGKGGSFARSVGRR